MIKVIFVIAVNLLFKMVQGEKIAEWIGGTNNVELGVSHQFSTLSNMSSIYLKVEVYETDFSNALEYVNDISLNSVRVLSRCNPKQDNGRGFYVCLSNFDVLPYIDKAINTLEISVSATTFVNMYPYKGSVLYCRFTLNNELYPTSQPTSFPSKVPSFRPTVIPTSSPTVSHMPTSHPSTKPTKRPSAYPTLLPSVSLLPSSSTPSEIPSSYPSTSFPTLPSSFKVSWQGGTNKVTGGISHSFVGLSGVPKFYLTVSVFNTDFNDANEYIDVIKVNNQIIMKKCNPSLANSRKFFDCVLQYEILSSKLPRDGNIVVFVNGTKYINCCHEREKLLLVRITISEYQSSSHHPTVAPTSIPSARPTTSIPSTTPTTVPSVLPTCSPTLRPSLWRSPTSKPSVRPTVPPSTLYPTNVYGFADSWEGGTNNVLKGVQHTFYGLAGFENIFLRVEVYETDFSDPDTEYISKITANHQVLSTKCSPERDKSNRFYLCLSDVNVASAVVEPAGTLSVVTYASPKVNSYNRLGYLLYVKYTVSALQTPTSSPTVIPTSRPTTSPSTIPTALPSAAPTRTPSSLPSRNPTREPSSVPTRSPTVLPSTFPSTTPSVVPTLDPTGSEPSQVPTFLETSPYVWSGGSGSWHVKENWNRRSIPNELSDVIIHLNANDTIFIYENATINSLQFTGNGSMILTGNTIVLTILDLLNVTGGVISSSISDRLNGISSMNNTAFSGEFRIYFENITLWNFGYTLWSGADIIMANSNIQNMGKFVIESKEHETLCLKADTSWSYYTHYLNSILNVDAQLSIVLPANKAVYDRVVNRTVYPTSLLSVDVQNSTTFWALSVQMNKESAAYYAYDLNTSFLGVLYNETVDMADSDSCAEKCNSYDWCKSFDYYPYLLYCSMSSFSHIDVGGLTEITSNMSLANHYERVPKTAEKISHFINMGELSIYGDGNVKFETSIHFLDASATYIHESSNLIVSGGGNATDFAKIFLCNASLSITEGNFEFAENTSITNLCPVRISNIIFSTGNHQSVSLLSNISVLVQDYATLTFPTSINYQVPRISVSNYASVVIPDGSRVVANVVNIGSGGALYSGNLSVICDTILIQENSTLTATGMGELMGQGIGQGTDATGGGSGGGHGGIGGGAIAHAGGSGYGSVVWPTNKGSGGGNGFFATTGGSGGGILTIYCNLLHIDGEISSDGDSGELGGGGGSGGSIAINATRIEGNGLISSRGGNGGYAGGTVSGGAGGGGRIAIYSYFMDYTGSIDASGGYRKSTYNIIADRPGAGTVFVRFQNNSNVFVDCLLISVAEISNIGPNIDRRIPFSIFNDDDLSQEGIRRNTVVVAEDYFAVSEIDIYIIGDANILVREGTRVNEVLVRTIISSPVSELPYFLVSKGCMLSFSESVAYVSNIKLGVYNTSIPSDITIELYEYGQMVFLGDHGLFSVNNLMLSRNAQLSFSGSSLKLQGQHLNVENSVISVLQSTSNLIFEYANFTDVQFWGSLSSENETTVLNVTIAACEMSGSVNISDISVINHGNITAADTMFNILNYGKLTNDNILQFIGESTFFELDRLDLVDSAEFCLRDIPPDIYFDPIRVLLTSTSYTYFSRAAHVTFVSSISIHGNVVVESNTSIQGGFVDSTSVIRISNDVVLSVGGSGLFVFEESSYNIVGDGLLFISGIVQIPRSIIKVPVHVSSAGCLVFDYVGLQYIEQLVVHSEGHVLVRSNVVIGRLSINGGSVHIYNSNFTIGDQGEISYGNIDGNGTVTVGRNSSLSIFTNDDCTEKVKILQIKLFNFGMLQFGYCAVEWGRGAFIDNYGSLEFRQSQAWNHVNHVRSFNKYYLDKFGSDITTLASTNTTAEQCAQACLNKKWPVVYELGRYNQYTEYQACKGFVHNVDLFLCYIVFDADKLDINMTKVDVSDWTIYLLENSWPYGFSLFNRYSGSIVVYSTAMEVSINAKVYNNGSITVTDDKSSLKFMSSYVQGEMGSVNTTGNISFVDESYLLGNITGTGGYHFTSGNHLLGSNILSSSTYLHVVQGGKLTVHGNVKSIDVHSIYVDEGIMETMSQISLVVKYLILDNSGILHRSNNMIHSDDFTCQYDICNDINISAFSVTLHNNSTIDYANAVLVFNETLLTGSSSLTCSGRGYSQNFNGSYQRWSGTYGFLGSSGGSHGGFGGNGYGADTNNLETAYGNLYSPNSWGSCGGGLWSAAESDNIRTSGSGGGALTLIGGTLSIWNSFIKCNGNSGSILRTGGGAGGSILIKVDNISGSSTAGIIAQGGSGYHDSNGIPHGGGGGGGRISLLCNDSTSFLGYISSSGGTGYQIGSSGTVFRYLFNESNYQNECYLTLDNDNQDTQKITKINDHLNPFCNDLNINVVRKSRSAFAVNGESVLVRRIFGDGSGHLKLMNGTIFRSTDVIFHIYGVQVLIQNGVLDASRLNVVNHAALTMTINGNTMNSINGYYDFETVQVNDYSSVIFKYDSHTSSSEIIYLNASKLYVSSTSHIHSNGEGFAGDDWSSSHNSIGAGAFGLAGGGGGGYGGSGGDGLKGEGGKSYGNFSYPVSFGSGGGGAHGGAVGGRGGGIVFIGATEIYLDGTISSNGNPGIGSGAGGGSGGSIYIRTELLTGGGTIAATGGNGTISKALLGGAGSGGRISCNVISNNSFYGDITAFGGRLSYHNDTAETYYPIVAETVTDLLNKLNDGLSRASSGTVLLSCLKCNSTLYSSIIVDNSGLEKIIFSGAVNTYGIETTETNTYVLEDAFATLIIEDEYWIDKIYIRGHGNVLLSNGSLFVKGNLISDSTGEIEILENSKLCAISSSLVLSEVNMALKGSFATSNNVILDQSSIIVYPSVFSVDSLGQVFTGVWKFESLTARNGSQIIIKSALGYNSPSINCSTLTIDSTSLISADGEGFPVADPGDIVPLGYIAKGDSNFGDGGWHAGLGESNGNSYAPYGNAYQPRSSGAAGGSTLQYSGENGGGAICIYIETSCILDGIISANGNSCGGGGI
jgi:hypothetical protein